MVSDRLIGPGWDFQSKTVTINFTQEQQQLIEINKAIKMVLIKVTLW